MPGWKCIRAETVPAGGAIILEDGEPLELPALNTTFYNLDAGLSSCTTAAAGGGLSIQQVDVAAGKVADLFEKAVFEVMNSMHSFSMPKPVSRSPMFTPGTPSTSPQRPEDDHKRRGRSSSPETVVAAEERAVKRPRR